MVIDGIFPQSWTSNILINSESGDTAAADSFKTDTNPVSTQFHHHHHQCLTTLND